MKIKERLTYMLSYEYSAKGKKEFAIGFLFGLLLDILIVLGIIAVSIVLVYILLTIKMRF